MRRNLSPRTPDLKHYLLTSLIDHRALDHLLRRHQAQHGQHRRGLSQHQHRVHRVDGTLLVQAEDPDL